MLNRSVAPEIKPLRRFFFPAYSKVELDNGIPLYLLPYGSQEIIELYISVPAGNAFTRKKGLAQACEAMLLEGTDKYDSGELAKALNNFGAILRTDTGQETATIHLTCLTRHLEKILPILQEVVFRASFPEAEFSRFKAKALERLTVQAERTEYIAVKNFKKLLFGDRHPYGYMAAKEDIESLSVAQLRRFYSRNYAPANMRFIVAGKFNPTGLVNAINSAFGAQKLVQESNRIDRESSLGKLPPNTATDGGYYYFKKEGAQQATIRVGHLGMAAQHPDYYAMKIVTNILGGHFTSRLMRNIREDKGYTYGVHASWSGYKYHGSFFIQTDVANEYADAAREEIRKELQRLIERGLEQEELDLVKNYMIGQLISSRETAAQVAQTLSAALVNEIVDGLNEKITLIDQMTVHKVHELAREYYAPERLIEVVSGDLK